MGWIVLVVGFLMSLGLTVLATRCKVFQEKKNSGYYSKPEITYGPIHVGGMATFLVIFWLLCAAFIGLLIEHTFVTSILTGIVLTVCLAVFGIIVVFDSNSPSAKLWDQIKGKLNELGAVKTNEIPDNLKSQK